MANWQAIGTVLGEYYSPQNQRGLLESQAMKKAIRGDELTAFEKAILKYDPDQIQAASEELKMRMQEQRSRMDDAAAQRAAAEERRRREAAQQAAQEAAAAEFPGFGNLDELKKWTLKHAGAIGLDRSLGRALEIEKRQRAVADEDETRMKEFADAQHAKSAMAALAEAETYEDHLKVIRDYPDVPDVVAQAKVLARELAPEKPQYVQYGTLWNELRATLGRNPTQEELVAAMRDRKQAESAGTAAGKPAPVAKAPGKASAPSLPADIKRFVAVMKRMPKNAQELADFNAQMRGGAGSAGNKDEKPKAGAKHTMHFQVK